jgi:hypothetical protein
MAVCPNCAFALLISKKPAIPPKSSGGGYVVLPSVNPVLTTCKA